MAALLVLPAVATAQDGDDNRPQITRAPKVRGDFVVGKRIETHDARWHSDGPTTVTYTWLRCESGSLWDCEILWGRNGTQYTLTAADQGMRMRVLLEVRNRDGSAYLWSDASNAVAAPPPPPPPPTPPSPPSPPSPPVDPDPDPDPDPTDPSEPTTPGNPGPTAPTAVAPGPDAVAAPPAAGGVRGTSLRSMRPSAVVRMRGWLTQRGAQVNLLTVRAPRGAQITVSCIGRGCPRERWGRATIVTRVKVFEGALRAGVRLVVRVTRPGFVGKHTIFQIRRGKAPTRRDRCLYPGTRSPQPCRPAD